MCKKMIIIASFVSTLILTTSMTYASPFGRNLCKLPEYDCIQVESGQSWASLFPDPDTRALVKKINRMNTALYKGMIIAVPKDTENANHLEHAPFPEQISGGNVVHVDISDLAWGAYDASGSLVNWGPISGGKNYCKDVGRSCRTIMGTFTFYSKKGPGCKSGKFPLPRGGAPMPYCMHFHGGFAMHGSPTVPGYNASHGCVRMFVDDAKWMNEQFVRVGSTRVKIVP